MEGGKLASGSCLLKLRSHKHLGYLRELSPCRWLTSRGAVKSSGNTVTLASAFAQLGGSGRAKCVRILAGGRGARGLDSLKSSVIWHTPPAPALLFSVPPLRITVPRRLPWKPQHSGALWLAPCLHFPGGPWMTKPTGWQIMISSHCYSRNDF